MILIVSFEANEHVEAVRRHLSADSVVVDTAWFPSRAALDVRLADDFESRRLILPDGRGLHLGQIGAVWYRRIRPLGLHADLTDGTSRLFAWSESNEALLGL